MKYAYVAIFIPEEKGAFHVSFPDLPGCNTSGEDMIDAVHMAQDVLCLTLYDLEQDNGPIPKASKPDDIKITGDQFTSVIVADTERCRRLYERKSVKKTLSIPMWLNERAERENINFSGVLQEALKARLHIQE